MDAKNLAVLMKLKCDMEAAAKPAPKPSSTALSEESLQALKDLAKERFEAEPRRTAKDPIAYVRAECRSCKSIYSLEPGVFRPHWTCSACKRAKKQAQQEDQDSKRAAQYANATGTKLQEVERQIQIIREKIEIDDGPNRRGLLLRLAELEKKLALEKVHAISKLSSIRARKVPGSYGSTR